MSKTVVINSGLLTGPMVLVRNEKMISHSNLIFSLLILFLYVKRVSVEPETETVRIQRRIFWLFKIVRDIPFEKICRVDYEFSKKFKDISLCDLLLFSLIFRNRHYYFDRDGNSNLWGRYIVSVILKDSTEVKLWSFSGRDDADSLYCTEYLQHLTDKPLVQDSFAGENNA